ncbi:MAG: hypothetical protein GY730_10590 [bacterium]|nr:hypothetical protein [bacterium]
MFKAAKKITKNFQNLKDTWIVILFITVISILYGDSLFYGYITDDFGLITTNIPEILSKLYHGEQFRPLWYFSYYLTNYFFQSSIFDHLINLLLYCFAVVLAYKFALNYTSKLRSVIVILFWIILPWTVFPVVWISQRNDLIMYIFVLLSLNTFLKGNIFRAGFFALLSFLGKVTSMFFPIFFIYRGIKEKKIHLIVTNSLLFFCVFFLALFGFLNHVDPAYSQNINIFFKASKYLFHIIESSITQFIPMPFYINKYHFAIYAISLIFAFKALKLTSLKNIRDIIVLALLFALPTAICPQLRVVGMESFFILLIIVSSVKVANEKYLAVFITLFTLFNVLAVFEIKRNFNEESYTKKSSYSSVKSRYYLNDYYKNKQAVLLKIMRLAQKTF